MLKNTKAVGVASAIALLTGVAFAPSATAVFSIYPLIVVWPAPVPAGGVVKYSVFFVLKGCKVITTLGSVTRTEKATGGSRDLTGVVRNKRIPAPSKAGKYTLRSKIANDCAAEAGYSHMRNMARTITVGDEVSTGGGVIDGWENVGAKAVRIFGIASVGATAIDLGAIKVQAYVRGELVASTYTNATTTGAFSIVIESKYLNKKRNTQVTLKLASNKFYWMDQKFGVDRQVD
jgi:hypothetical protein